MLYVKPGLKGLDANVNAYCSGGSGATASLNTMCQEGTSANYCSGGSGDTVKSDTCFGGMDPTSGSCAPGQSANGWSTCNVGSTVGV